MSLDPLADDLLPLAEAARTLPRLRNGRPVSPSTLWRWSARGLRGVKLRVVRVGHVACTSKSALRQFFADVEAARSRAEQVVSSVPAAPTPASEAAAALSACGI